MSEESVAEEVEEVVESQEEAVEETEVQADSQENIARSNGWRPKDEWSGNENEWVSAAEFNRRGELIGTIKRLEGDVKRREQEFNERLENQHKLFEANKKALVEDLKNRRKEAISEADVDKAEELQSRIDDLNVEVKQIPEANKQTSSQSSFEEQQYLNEWNAKNPWVTEFNPKSSFAHDVFNAAIQQGKNRIEAAKEVDRQIAIHYPPTNQKRKQATTVEVSRSNPSATKHKKLNWGDLTADEEKSYKIMPNAWKDKEQFLQAVTDIRKLEGKS